MFSTVRKFSFYAGLSLLASTVAYADVAPDFMDKLTSDARPLEDRERDGARRPYQVMMLLGVDAGMTAIDVGAAAGWYTRVLSAAVGPTGKVYMQEGPRAMQQNNGQEFRDVAASLGNVEVSFENLGDMGSNIADIVVTALNLHHANDERGIAAMKELFTVLKPGGRAAVIDHIAAANTPANAHRMNPADAKRWIEAAGLEVVTESDILHTTADDHSMSAFAPQLGRNTDRFLYIVRKPG
jgi:predicted methyltransferase